MGCAASARPTAGCQSPPAGLQRNERSVAGGIVLNIPRNIAVLMAGKGLALAVAAWLLFRDTAYPDLSVLLAGLAVLSFILAFVVPMIGEKLVAAKKDDDGAIGDSLS